MAYDIELGKRLTKVLSEHSHIKEKHMFGGLAFLFNGNMCVGIHKDELIIRVGEDVSKTLLKETHVSPMNFTGRTMKGWAMVSKKGLKEDRSLVRYVNFALDFTRSLPKK